MYFRILYEKFLYPYRCADMSLARPWKETNHNDKDFHYTKTYGVQTKAKYCSCLYAKSLGVVV